MKTLELRRGIKVVLCIFMVMIAISLLLGSPIAYSATNDKTDQNSKYGAFIYGSGYVIDSTQKTDNVLNQAISFKNSFEEASKAVQADLKGQLAEKGEIKPELKKKTSGGEAEQSKKTYSDVVLPGIQIDDSAPGELKRPGATEQKYYDPKTGKISDTYEEGRRLLSEVIGGKRYVYVGFDNIGYTTTFGSSNILSIQLAIDVANSFGGGIVVVDNRQSYYDYGFTVKDGVTLLGGYHEVDGKLVRDTNSLTQINGGVTLNNYTELNGFKINGDVSLATSSTELYYGVTPSSRTNVKIYNNSIAGHLWILGASNVTVYNNTIKGEGPWWNECRATIIHWGSNIQVLDNDIFGDVMMLDGSSRYSFNNFNISETLGFMRRDTGFRTAGNAVIDHNTFSGYRIGIISGGHTSNLTVEDNIFKVGRESISIGYGRDSDTFYIRHNLMDGGGIDFSSAVGTAYIDDNLITHCDSPFYITAPHVPNQPRQEINPTQVLASLQNNSVYDCTFADGVRGVIKAAWIAGIKDHTLGAGQSNFLSKPPDSFSQGIGNNPNQKFDTINPYELTENVANWRWNDDRKNIPKAGIPTNSYIPLYVINNTHNDITEQFGSNKENTKGLSTNTVTAIFKFLLADKETGGFTDKGTIDQAELAKKVTETLKQSSMAVPLNNTNDRNLKEAELRVAILLAGMIKSPTTEQREMLDVAQSILNDASQLAQDTDSEKLAKAENECLQVISAVFLAQALPDLLKEGDMTRIRDIFSEVKNTKESIIARYKEFVKPYYEAMAKELAESMSVLHDKKLLSENLTKEAILKLTPKEIDEVMNKIKADPNKTQEEESILQQEAKYRAMYIIPNQKLLEASMKTLLNDLANKLYTILYGTGAIREDIVGKK